MREHGSSPLARGDHLRMSRSATSVGERTVHRPAGQSARRRRPSSNAAAGPPGPPRPRQPGQLDLARPGEARQAVGRGASSARSTADTPRVPEPHRRATSSAASPARPRSARRRAAAPWRAAPGSCDRLGSRIAPRLMEGAPGPDDESFVDPPPSGSEDETELRTGLTGHSPVHRRGLADASRGRIVGQRLAPRPAPARPVSRS